MPLRFWLHLAEIALALVLASALFISWRGGCASQEGLKSPKGNGRNIHRRQ